MVNKLVNQKLTLRLIRTNRQLLPPYNPPLLTPSILLTLCSSASSSGSIHPLHRVWIESSGLLHHHLVAYAYSVILAPSGAFYYLCCITPSSYSYWTPYSSDSSSSHPPLDAIPPLSTYSRSMTHQVPRLLVLASPSSYIESSYHRIIESSNHRVPSSPLLVARN